jgi:uncharacterized protein
MRLRCASAADNSTRAQWAWLVLLLILASPALGSEPKFPALTGRVVDGAGVLSASTQNQLTNMLADHERTTGEQLVVVTLDSLQGFSIEDYGYQLGRYWGIGQKGKNTGAILIVAPKEHKVRIEVGYGLEGELTDARSRTIIESSILPSFKRGDYNAGVIAGTTSILRVLGGNPTPIDSAKVPPPNIFESIFILLLFLIPVIGSLFLVSAMVSGPGKFQWGNGSYGGDGGSSGGSSSGGGFSGGGGSFGGGGASGSW